MRHFFLLVLAGIFIVSCNKESVDTPSTEYFPNTIGNHWKYKFVDSSAGTTEFVDISIVGSRILTNGYKANIWTSAFKSHTDTSFVYLTGDTIRFVDKDLNITNTYVVPFVLNSQWATYPDFKYDSSRVIESRSFLVNNTRFDNSYSIYKYGHLPNSHWSRIEWFSPRIGMLTRNDKSVYTIANENTNIYWELVSYQLK